MYTPFQKVYLCSFLHSARLQLLRALRRRLLHLLHGQPLVRQQRVLRHARRPQDRAQDQSEGRGKGGVIEEFSWVLISDDTSIYFYLLLQVLDRYWPDA